MADRPNPSLTAWGDALRAARRRRIRLRRVAIAIGIGTTLLAGTIAVPPRPRLVWNATASMTTGLYMVGPAQPIGRGDTVIVRLTEPVARLAAIRHYLPLDVPLLKHVGAEPGDRICAIGTTITIGGRVVAVRRARDSIGRPLPWWSGCETLRNGRLFLLANVPDSFDSRYFGPVERSAVIGRARLLWAASTQEKAHD